VKGLLKILPWFWLVFFGAEIVAVMFAPKKEGEYHVREFASLPVLLNGRVQPFDSVARNSLLQIRSTGDLPLEQVPAWQFWHHAKKLKSSEWLLELMTRPEDADTRPAFLIHHAELLGELKLQDAGIERSGLRYYTFNQLEPVLGVISEQGRRADSVKPEEQTTFQKQVVKLANAVMLYQRLKVTLQPEGEDDFVKELRDFKQNFGPAQAAAQANPGGTNFNKEAVERVAVPLREFQVMKDYSYPLIVPPEKSALTGGGWQNMGTAILDSRMETNWPPAVNAYAAMATAYRQHKPDDFNRQVAAYREWLEPRFVGDLTKGSWEFYYNNIKPFLHATIIYLFAFILACGAILTSGSTPNLFESLRRSALYLVVLAGIVHTFGLVLRMVLEGRPPVTNLYSSAIFIGWATMVIGIIIERIYRVGLGSLVASLAGFITLLIAHNLALGGDTMEMLRAVLDTNFWLATHVVVITLGYAATFFAGLLAIIYILLGIFTPMLNRRLEPNGTTTAPAEPASTTQPEIGQVLSRMVYGVICFATLFSFVGTVLGGIWADQSWGRFWGWDPKENGALLLVLWNAIILHVRWGRLLGDRGIMNLAVFGNVVTSFSWFGVNMLGIGLHSYGFMDAAFKWLMIFMASQACIIGLGLLPLHLWRSFRPAPIPAPAAPGSKPRSARPTAAA
jgi:cytochrome c-type biogenesis protein CcsB